jgi:hypothetical protein
MIIVNVTVTRTGIEVDKDPVIVPKGQPDVPIRWRIKTPGWKFADNGIEIRKNYSAFDKRRREDPQTFHWRSRNKHKKYYEYTISVANRTTKASRDPGISNGGHKAKGR